MVVPDSRQPDSSLPTGGNQRTRVSNVSELVTVHAGRQPDHVALVEPGVAARTWAQLDAVVGQVGAGLAARGLVAGQRIGLDGPNSIAWVVAYLAALRAGLVVVPTDPEDPIPDRDDLLSECGVRALFTTRTPVAGGQVSSWELSEGGLASLRAAHVPVATPRDPESLAVLACTLGSSGDRKIVMLSHRALLANLEQLSDAESVSADGVIAGVLPFCRVYGLNAVLGSSLAAGAQLVIPDPSTWDLAAIVESEQVDQLPITPGLLYRLAHDEIAIERLRGVRRVIVAGAALPIQLSNRFTELTGVQVERAYGLTEAAPAVSSTVGTKVLGPFHVGRPLPGVEVRIDAALSSDSGDASEPGEILIRGANLFSGYWPDGRGGPDADGWFATGDLGYLSDGELFLVDRSREVVTIRGFRVYPSEVEQLIRQLPGVEAAVVVSRPVVAGDTGSSGGGLVVFVTGDSVTHEQVSEFIQTRLPVFKRPQEVRIVDRLPLGMTGVVQRAQLRRQLARESAS
ncbi:MAG: class I adenylate-forming enzyme family protein [Microlunatus sp.]